MNIAIKNIKDNVSRYIKSTVSGEQDTVLRDNAVLLVRKRGGQPGFIRSRAHLPGDKTGIDLTLPLGGLACW